MGNDLPNMITKVKGTNICLEPLQVYQINDTYILAVYQGRLSEFDMLLRYRQKVKDKKKPGNLKWSLLRTPKHIHWAVDILIKMHQDKQLTKSFVNFLLKKWKETNQHTNKEHRLEMISIENLLPQTEKEAQEFYKLNNFGEYSVKFLLLMAKILMQQEKNNMKDAYMFRKLLETLEEGEDIFSIVQKATYIGRK